jgi:hypothetical protein
MRLAQNSVQQCCFTSAKKAGKDGGGDQCHGAPENQMKKKK